MSGSNAKTFRHVSDLVGKIPREDKGESAGVGGRAGLIASERRKRREELRGGSLMNRTLRKSQPGKWGAFELRLSSRTLHWAELAGLHCCHHAPSLAGGAQEKRASVYRPSQIQKQ